MKIHFSRMLAASLSIILIPSLLIAEPFDVERHEVYYQHPKISKFLDFLLDYLFYCFLWSIVITHTEFYYQHPKIPPWKRERNKRTFVCSPF